MSTRHPDIPGRRRAAAMAALLALGAPLLSHAAAQAHLDRSATSPDGALTLSITSDTASSGIQPDLSPLRADFQVLGTSSGSNTTIFNGQRSDQLRWDIRLSPRHAGRIEIPPLAVGPDRTAALEVTVAEASSAQRSADGQHAFVEVEANPASLSPYVQQQIPYTVRLFYDDSVTPTQLDAPAPANAVVEQLGPDKHGTATRHGQAYHVIERDYAIAPEKSGALVIPPPRFRGTEAVAGRAPDNDDSQDDPIARMLADTPFANMPGMRAFQSGSPFAQQTREISAPGRQVLLDVKPRPVGVRGDWLPAEQLSLQDDWDRGVPAFKVGEPVTRVITIQAKGLAASQIPAVPIASLANARVYPEAPENQSKTDGRSIYGVSKQSVTYLPTQSGALDVPAIDVPWWDVSANVQRHATLPAFHIDVAPGVAGAQTARTPPVGTSVPTRAAQALGPVAGQPNPTSPSRTLIVGLAAGAVLALALLTYALRRRRRSAPGTAAGTTGPNALPRRAAAMRALQDACAGHAATRAAQSLLDLSRFDWPSDPPLGLAALAARVERGRHEILALDRCLYAGSDSGWDGNALWLAVRAGWHPASAPSKPHPSGLEPLYPRMANRGSA